MRICIRVLVMSGANTEHGCIILRPLTRSFFYDVAIPQYITCSRPPQHCIIRIIYRVAPTGSEAPDIVNSELPRDIREAVHSRRYRAPGSRRSWNAPG